MIVRDAMNWIHLEVEAAVPVPVSLSGIVDVDLGLRKIIGLRGDTMNAGPDGHPL